MTAAAAVNGPAVSFVIPAYNAAQTLRHTLASLQAQDVDNWEAIVVDDGSRDRTAQLATGFAVRDARIRVVRQANAGPSAARNHGIREARADRIAFLDSDDWIAPDYLSTLMPLAAGPDRLAYCAYSLVLPSGTVCPPDFCRQLETDPFSVLAWRCEPAIHCVVAPRRLIEAVGGFDEDMRCCEDWDLWLRLVRAGARFVGTPRALAYYRMLPGSLSSQDESGERHAERVRQRARQTDPRLPPNAPFRDSLPVPDKSDREMAEWLAEAVAAIASGRASSCEWFLRHPERWRALIAQDPECFPTLLYQDALRRKPSAADAPLLGALLGEIDRIDPAFVKAARDACDLYRAKIDEGVFGRYLSLAPDLANLPDRIDPPAGVDCLILRVAVDTAEPTLLAIPLPEAVTRSQLVTALIAAVPLAPLLRSSGALRSSRFWLTAGVSLVATGLASPATLIGNARAVLGRSLRSGVAKALQGAPLEQPRVPPREISIPILLVPTITANDSGLLSAGIGQGQLLSLLNLLRQEGYGRTTLGKIVAMRKQPSADESGLIALVFCDLSSARQSGLLQDPVGADVLLAPAELRRLVEERDPVRRAERDLVRFGLKIDHFAPDTSVALAQARELLAMLRFLNGDEGPVAAISERRGLDDSILAYAGFAPILSPASKPLRLSAHGDVFPAIDCSGAEALGNVIECLRAA